MMETQEVDYAPPDAFRKIDLDDVTRDRDNPVGYLSFQGREEPLYKEKTVLGRDSDSDIIVDSPQISRHHATFKVNQKQNAIFICVYGKNNYLNGEELDTELFYQVTDGSLIDFRSVKMSFKSNNEKPGEMADDNPMSAEDKKNSAENKENQNQSQNESSLVESTHDEADVHQAPDEEENTQFEDDLPAPSPEAEVLGKEEQENKEESGEKEGGKKPEDEVVEENTLKIPFEDNPFLEDSQLNFAKPSGSGFRLRRLPSFESQEQLISEMETQPLDVPLIPPYAVKSDKSKWTDTSGDSQMSLEHVELSVSLEATQPPIRIVIEDTQPINTITIESQTQAPKAPKVRKTLSYEEPTKASDIMVISSDDDEEAAPRPGPSRAANVAAEPEVEISPIVMRRRKTATASDTGESLVGSPEQPISSSTPQTERKIEIADDTDKEQPPPVENVPKVDENVPKVDENVPMRVDENVPRVDEKLCKVDEYVSKVDENVLMVDKNTRKFDETDENNVSDEESDGIVEASDDEETTAKRFFVKDSQDIFSEESNHDTSAGIINETQEEESDSTICSNNITAVEVVTKEKEVNVDAYSQDKQEVNESLIEDDVEEQEASVCDKIIPVSANKTPLTSGKKKPKRISKLSLRRSTSPQKPIASTSSEENFVSDKGDFETTTSQDNSEEVRDLEQSQDKQVSTPEVVEKKDMPNKDFKSPVADKEKNVEEIPALDADVDTPEKTNSPVTEAAVNAEEAPSSDDESLKKVDLFYTPPVNKEIPKEKKALPIARERSPVPDVSIAEEVKMSPRLSKIAAAEKLESPKSVQRTKLIKSATKIKNIDAKKQSEAASCLEPNAKKQGQNNCKVSADDATDSESGQRIFLKPKKQTQRKSTPRDKSSSDKGSESETETKVLGRGRRRTVAVAKDTVAKIAEEKVAKKRTAQITAKSAEEPKVEEPPAKSPRKGKKDEEKQTTEPLTVPRRRGRKAPESIEKAPQAIAAPSPRKRNAKTAKTVDQENIEVLLEPPAKSPRKSGRSKETLPVESVEPLPESSALAQSKDESPLDAPAQPESEGRPKRRRTLARKMQESMETVQRDAPKRKAAVTGAAKKEVTPGAGTKSASKVTKAAPSSRSSRRKQTEAEEKTEKDEEEKTPPVDEQKSARRVRQSRAQKVPAEAEPQTSQGKKGKTATKKEVISSPLMSNLKNARVSRKDSFVQNAPKRGRQTATSSSLNSSDSQSKTRTKTYVFFSGFEGSLEKEMKLVTKLGGYHKDDVPEKKHKGEEFILVVNGSFKRTLKVIDIIGHGAPIVSESWLRACEKADTFVDAWNFILLDKAAEKKFGFSLRECLTKANQNHDVFASWSIYFTPNVKPSGAHLKKCVEALGGKYLATKPRTWPANNLMVVSCEEDQENYRIIMKSTRNKNNVPFVTVQGLFECMQQQKIVNFDKFTLK